MTDAAEAKAGMIQSTYHRLVDLQLSAQSLLGAEM